MDFNKWIVFVTVVAVMLQNNISDASTPKRFYCHGDYCRTDGPEEFCSETYRICRPCADIIDDCFSPNLPQNCLSTCIRHNVGQQIKELQGNPCPDLTEIAHGKHNGSLKDSPKPGQVIKYTCDQGFRLHGERDRECKPYGYWSSEIPTCKEQNCAILPAVSFGMHNGSSNTWPSGTVVATSCTVGHQVYGKNTTVCKSDGLWSNSLPVCKPIRCIEPHPIRNGTWLNTHKASRQYVWGHLIKARCGEGYIMDGLPIWNCTDEGYWENSGSKYMPVCFLQGDSATCAASIAWYIVFGVLLVSLSLNAGCLYMLVRKRSIHDFRNRRNGSITPKKMSDIDDEIVYTDEENKMLLGKEVISLRDHKQPREKVIMSGESNIPAPNTYNSQNKELTDSDSSRDTPQKDQGNVTVIANIINNNNNHNTIETSAESSSVQTPPNIRNNASQTTQTAQPNACQADRPPVEETGISCVPSQPESSGGIPPNQPASSGCAVPNHPESSFFAVPNQSKSSGCALPNQSESSGGALPNQPASSGGAQSNQSESPGSALPNQLESFGDVLPNQLESFGGSLSNQSESSVCSLPDLSELSNCTPPN